MGIVWIIQKPVEEHPSIAHALMGDFAVRVFASPETFLKICGLNHYSGPSLLVASCFEAPLTKHFIESFLFRFPAAMCLGVGYPNGEEQFPKVSGQFVYHRWQDSFTLSGLVRRYQEQIRGEQAISADRLKFQDIVFDPQQFGLRILPDETFEALPPKEARIIHLLISTPGQVLSREQIKKVVWSGVAVSSRTIDSHISRLRKRLDGAETTIESVYGGGYVLR